MREQGSEAQSRFSARPIAENQSPREPPAGKEAGVLRAPI
jgi:hypothetical protein